MARPQRNPDTDPPGEGPVESTASLLEQARHGDDGARNRLVNRLLPGFKRWAHGRLPNRARDLVDTDDLVQVTLVKALKRLKEFEPRHDGAFVAYLRQILLNEIRQEIRRCGRRPARQELNSDLILKEPSPLEMAVGRDVLDDYEVALARLPAPQRDAVVLRVELQFTYEEIAGAMGSPSANAARMMVKRALLLLAQEKENVRRER